MSILISAGETTAARKRVYFHLVDATDGISAETGEAAGQPQISTDGAAFTNTGIGTLVAIGNGRYYGELTDATVTTISIIESRFKSANTAEGVGTTVQVVAFDPDDATDLGLTSVASILADTGTDGVVIAAGQTVSTATNVGTVNSVTTGVTVATNNDKTGYDLAADQSAVTIGTATNVGVANSVNVRTGYSLAADQSAVTVGTVSNVGVVNSVTTGVTVATNSDKTGYSLAADQSSVTVGTASNVDSISAAGRVAIGTTIGARLPSTGEDVSAHGSYDWVLARLGLAHKQTVTDDADNTATGVLFKADGATQWGSNFGVTTAGTSDIVTGAEDTA